MEEIEYAWERPPGAKNLPLARPFAILEELTLPALPTHG
jgi:hypothetical protein